MKAKQIYIPVGILALGLMLMFILLNIKSEAPKRKPVVRPKVVGAELIQLKNIKSQISAYGRLASSQPVILYSEVTGILEKGSINFQSASSFKKGDLLIKVDDRQIRLDLKLTSRKNMRNTKNISTTVILSPICGPCPKQPIRRSNFF